MNTTGLLVDYFPIIDEYGRPVQRTKREFPYSYDGFVTYRSGKNEEVAGTVYSDRLSQQDYKRNRELKLKHFGDTSDYFNSRNPIKIQDFLREHLNIPELKIIFIMEYCNRSSGYPVWRFDFKV